MKVWNRFGFAGIVAGALLLATAPPALSQIALIRGTPATIGASPSTYTMTIEQSYWNVVGVSSASDWDLAHGTATSTYSGNACDFVLADGNPGAIAGNSGTATRLSGSALASLVHAGHGSTLTANAAATYAWLNTDILYFWEVNITTAGTYDVIVTGNSSLNYAWFHPGSTAGWINRGAAAFTASVGTPTFGQIFSAGWHCLVVYLDGGAGTTTTVKVSVSNLALTQDTPVTLSSAAQYLQAYRITPQASFWNAVAVSANDWDMNHGGVVSNQTGAPCDFVVADGNAGAITSLSGYVSLYSGSVNATLEHAGTSTLTMGTAFNYNWTSTHVVHLWEVNIATAGQYDVSVTGSSNLKYAWFSPAATASWQDRSTAFFGNTVGTALNNQPLSVGTHCLVVYRDGGAGTTSTLSLLVQPTPTPPAFAATSVSVVGAPVNVNPDGTFQVTRSIQNTGGTAGSTPYSIRLSANTTVTTADTEVYAASTASIGPGASDTLTVTCTVPSSMPTGSSYYVGLYIADGNTAVTANQDVSVVAASFSADSVSVVSGPVTVYPGAQFEVSRSIRNTGLAAGTVAYSIHVSANTDITSSDTEIYSGVTSSIDPGATNTWTPTCTIPGSIPNGEYYVGLYLAPGNTACSAGPDVTVISPPPPPPTPSRGCGCSPVPGGAPGVFGTVLPYLLCAAGMVWARRRRRT